MKKIKEKIVANINNVRAKHPLVHNITNFVVMNIAANVLLAESAFPVMAHSIDEVKDMVDIADALVLNIGTLTGEWVESMIIAGKKANEKGIPVVFDPVGAGATPFRTEKSLEILEKIKISVLRGNASEINAIIDSQGKTRGVDSIHSVDDIIDKAVKFAKEKNLVIAVSGEIDMITDGTDIVRVNNGVPMMTLVTGLGCSLSSTVGAFVGANKDIFDATVSAFAYYTIAGEIASTYSHGPGTFAVAFLDALYNFTTEDVDRCKIE